MSTSRSIEDLVPIDAEVMARARRGLAAAVFRFSLRLALHNSVGYRPQLLFSPEFIKIIREKSFLGITEAKS